MTGLKIRLLFVLLTVVITSSISLASNDNNASAASQEKSKDQDVCSPENLKINLMVDKTTLTCEEHADTNDGYAHCSSNFFLTIASRCNRIKSMMIICKTNFLHAYRDKPEEFVPDRARQIEFLNEMEDKGDEYFKTITVKVPSSDYFVQDNPVVQVRPMDRMCDTEDIRMLPEGE